MLDDNAKNILKITIILLLIGLIGVTTIIMINGDKQNKSENILTDENENPTAAVSKAKEPVSTTQSNDQATTAPQYSGQVFSATSDFTNEVCSRENFNKLNTTDFYSKIKNILKYFQSDEKAKIERGTYDYLFCSFQKNEITYKQGKEILTSLNFGDYIKKVNNEATIAFFGKQDKYNNLWSTAFGFPVINFIFSSTSYLCNAGGTSPLFVANNLEYIQDVGKMTKLPDFYRTVFNNFCAEAEKLNADIFNSDILNFKNWSPEPEKRKFELSWKTKMAMRYIANKSDSEKIDPRLMCGTLLDENEKKDCQNKFDILYGLKEFVNSGLVNKITAGSCQTEKYGLIDIICNSRVIK